MRPSSASCANATLQGCRIGAVRSMARDRGAARACSAVRSALPGRVATNIVVNHAVPGRLKSSAERAALRSRNVGNRVVGERPAGGHRPDLVAAWRTSLHRPRHQQAHVLEDALNDCRILDSSAMTCIGSLQEGQKSTPICQLNIGRHPQFAG